MSFVEIAQVIAKKSKDPSTKVGAVIVDSENRIVSTGYNGFISKNDEEYMTFERPMKYHLTIHAEMNALLFAKQDLTGKIMYVTHSPCSECLKHILQCRIRKVYYGELYSKFEDEHKEAIRLLVLSTGAKIINVNTHVDYLTELGMDSLKLIY
jgi:dCMP deaminase